MGRLNFQEAVITKSHQKPVLVDFWAEWCGPCRILGPTLEQLAEEQSDRWELVKINTEEEQELAMQYRIQSIPNVKLFHKGQVIGEFAGALPRQQILKWLDEYLPDERKDALEHILQSLHARQPGALEQLEQFVRVNPQIKEGRVALAKEKVFADPEAALALVQDIPMGDPDYATVEDLRTLATLKEAEFDESPAGQALAAARKALEEADREAALPYIIQAVSLDKRYQDDLPRRLGIALFRSLGDQHPLTKDYRWKFNMALD